MNSSKLLLRPVSWNILYTFIWLFRSIVIADFSKMSFTLIWWWWNTSVVVMKVRKSVCFFLHRILDDFVHRTLRSSSWLSKLWCRFSNLLWRRSQRVSRCVKDLHVLCSVLVVMFMFMMCYEGVWCVLFSGEDADDRAGVRAHEKQRRALDVCGGQTHTTQKRDRRTISGGTQSTGLSSSHLIHFIEHYVTFPEKYSKLNKQSIVYVLIWVHANGTQE